jgi:hypothetical protein
VINTLQATTATTPSDRFDVQAPERGHAGLIYQLPAAFRPAQATPHYGVPQGAAGDGHRGLSCGWTIGPAPGHSTVAWKGWSP